MSNWLKFALFCFAIIVVLNVLAPGSDSDTPRKAAETKAPAEQAEAPPPEPEKPKLSAEEMKQRRELYALTEVAPKYCPNIETGWFVQGSIRYPMSDDDFALYKQAEDEWLQRFRKVGSRALACEALMQVYGPGGKLELFQFE